MKLKTFIISVLILVSNLLKGQEFIDQIFTKSNFTINWNITLINDKNIFYTYQKRNTEKHTYISLNEVISYNWKSKDIEFTNQDKDKLFPYNSTNNRRLGIKTVQQINYPISHSIIAINFSKMNHNIYLGPNYTHLFNNYFGNESVNDYEKDSIGINFGYQYIIDSKWKRTNFFLQIDFSVYKLNNKEYQGLFIGIKDEEMIIIENNGSIGINYKVSDNIELMGGIGIGSPEYFFLMINRFLPHSFIGLKYRIK